MGELPVATTGPSRGGVVETCRLQEEPTRGRSKALLRGGGLISKAQGWFAAGFSSGSVEVWRCAAPDTTTGAPEVQYFEMIRHVDTGVRLTCLALWPLKAIEREATQLDAAVTPRKAKKRRASREQQDS